VLVACAKCDTPSVTVEATVHVQFSVFSALIKYRVVKIAHPSSEVVLQIVIYPSSDPSSEVIALCLAV
jgi:hypothetical protein